MRQLFLIIPIACLALLAACTDTGKGMNMPPRDLFPAIKKPLTLLPKRLQTKQNILDSIFKAEYKQGIFNGSVAISYHDTLLYQSALGVQNIKTKNTLCNTTSFQLASVSKVFTAVAVLKLVEQNKLSIKDNIQKYFPNFPYQNIIIEQLLSHTSGLPNYLYFYYHLPKTDSATLTNKEVLDLLEIYKPAAGFKPGKRFQYCNTNYVLLALLVEQLSGKSFQAFLKETVFDVCDMQNTCFFTPEDTSQKKAVAFNYRKQLVGSDVFDGVVGDKGVCSTPQDMLLFAQNLFAGKIISNINDAIKPRAKTSYDRFYGLGFRINPNGGDTIVFHNGWWHGYRSAFQYRKRDHTTIVILSNRLDKIVYQTAKIFDAIDNKKGKAELEESE